MSISPISSSLDVLQLSGNSLVAGAGNSTGKPASGLSVNDVTPPAREQSPPAGVEGAQVTLSNGAAVLTQTYVPAPVYAEVWKGGQKMAVIDSRGHVMALTGMIAPSQTGGGGGGQELAARRAAQIAHSIGGEIRVAGQTMDVPTLNMRAKLESAYGVR